MNSKIYLKLGGGVVLEGICLLFISYLGNEAGKRVYTKDFYTKMSKSLNLFYYCRRLAGI